MAEGNDMFEGFLEGLRAAARFARAGARLPKARLTPDEHRMAEKVLVEHADLLERVAAAYERRVQGRQGRKVH